MTNQTNPEQPSDTQQILVELRELDGKLERYNEQFRNYQQATQWVVQLAFTLIASATLTVIITAVLKR